MRTLYFIFLLSSFLVLPAAGLQFISNPLPVIDTCEGKIILTLTRIWGSEENDDENQFFRLPADIKIDDKGHVYIVDTGNNRIQVFDRSGTFIRTIGRVGQGPGDLLMPTAIDFDKHFNIVTADSNNYRIQVYDPYGKYLSSFKLFDGQPQDIAVTGTGQIVVYSHHKSIKSHSFVTGYNEQGVYIREYGRIRDKQVNAVDFESFFLALDNEDNIFIAHYATPLFRKYSPKGDLLLAVSFEVPFKTPTVRVNESGDDVDINGEKKNAVSAGITVDQNGLIYVIAVSRPKTDKEKFFLVSGSDGLIRRFPQKIETEKTDRFRLLVFSQTGKILAAKKLAIFCDKIYVHGDSLFVIDRYMGMKIYEYKINF